MFGTRATNPRNLRRGVKLIPSRRAFATLVLGAILSLPCVAVAQTYTLPDGPLPEDCSGSGSTVTCTDDVELEGTQSLAVSGSVNWVIEGDFAIAADATVNAGGSASDLQMDVAGGVEVEGRGSVTATVLSEGDVTVSDDGLIDGSVRSGGAVGLEGRANVTGDVDSDGEFAAADDSAVGNNVDAGGEVSLQGRAAVGGSLAGGSSVDITDDASTAGDTIAAGSLSLSGRAEVGGRSESGTELTVEDDAAVRGGATAGSSATLEGRGLIEGDLNAAGSTALADNSQISGNVISGDSVTLEDNSAITGCVSAPEINSNGNIGCDSDLVLLASESQIQAGTTVTLAVAAQNCSSGDSGDADRWRDTWSSNTDNIDLSPSEETSGDSVCQRSPQRTVTFDQEGNYDVTFTAEYCTARGQGQGNNCNNFPRGRTETFGTDTVTITVGPPSGDATQLRFDQQPTETAADAVIDPSVTVRAEDDDGNLVESFTDDMTIAIENDPAGGTLNGTTTVAAEGGIATFDDLSIDEAGDPYTLTVSADGLAGVTSVEFAVTEPSAAASLVGEYRMEEPGWNGVVGEVSDTSGSGNDGTARNGADTAINTPDPAIPGNPGTCRYGEFDGDDDFARVPHDSSLEMSDRDAVTVSAWVRKASDQSGWVAIAQKSDTSYNLQLANGNEPTFTIYDGAWNQANAGFGLNTDQWYHLTGTYDGTEVRIYVDGQLEGTATATGQMADASSFDVGIGENLDATGRHFHGQIDEVRIYDQALSETQVASVANATHACGSLLTEYRMDEASWTGDSGEVTDRTGNGHDATAVGGSTTDGVDPARPGNVGTCRYGTLDGTNSGVDDDDAGTYLNGLSAVTVTGWVYNTGELNGNDRGIFFTGDPAPGKDHRLGIRYDTAGANGGGDNVIKAGVQTTACPDSEDCVQVETESNVMRRNQWQHVAMTWESGGDLRVYVDGTDVTGDSTGDINQGTGGTLDAVNGLSIGQGAKGQRWQGRIDEFRVYSAALAQTEIQQIFQDTHPCADAGLDHFLLVHDGAGINCRPENVILRAEDASGNRVTDYTGSVDLSTTTGNGDWAIGTGNGALAGGGGDDGSAEYTFVDADDGEVTLLYSNTHAETLNIDANDGSVSDDDNEGDITFRPWGFEFDPDPIPTQIAGRPFGLTLTAVGELPSDPGCNVIEEYDGDRDLTFWFDYEDPGSGTVDVTVDSEAIASSEAGATDQTVTFNNGEATVPVDYRDAGEIQLYAQDDDGVGEPLADSGGELVSGGAISGGTNPFVVRPFGFYIDFDPDGDGTFDDRDTGSVCAGQTSCAADAGGDVFATAGADFSARIAAVVWQSGDDDGSGRPTGNAVLADNAETPNFGQESTVETVDFAHTLIAPSPGASGSLVNGIGIGGFSGGAREVTDLRFSEVGIIDLDAALSDGAYLGTVDVTGAAANVGRFIPASFVVTERDAGMYAAACNDGFSYTGQAFGYDARPQLDITARNAAGTTTQNYRGNFIQLTTAGVTLSRATQDAAAVSNIDGDIDVAVSSTTGADDTLADTDAGDAIGNGTLVYTLPQDDTYTYDKVHNARIAPFDADLPITFDDVTDGDGVSEDTGASINAFTPMGVEIRFGRLIIDDAYGPEVAPVRQRWRIETWRGTNWATEIIDGCTSLALDTDVALDGNGAGTSPGDTSVTLNDSGGTGMTEIVNDALDVSSGTIEFANGTAAVRYAAPGAGERGWIGAATVLGTNHHLLVDDNGDGGNDGPYNANPSARVTFGVFAGESENIYLREVFPAP